MVARWGERIDSCIRREANPTAPKANTRSCCMAVLCPLMAMLCSFQPTTQFCWAEMLQRCDVSQGPGDLAHTSPEVSGKRMALDVKGKSQTMKTMIRLRLKVNDLKCVIKVRDIMLKCLVPPPLSPTSNHPASPTTNNLLG